MADRLITIAITYGPLLLGLAVVIGFRADKTSALRMAAVCCGFVYVTLNLRVPYFINLNPSSGLVLDLIALGPITFALASLSERHPLLVAPSALFGVALGVWIDVALDARDRNMFPIEVVFNCVWFSPGILAGSILGWWFGKHRQIRARIEASET
jgi:hypothetical protein